MNGPRLISESVPKVTKKAFSRKHIMLGRLMTRWPDIVGKELADKTQPVKIRRFSQGRNKKPGISLDIATSTADATLLHYQKDLILERINQIFGEQLVTAIRFVPYTVNAPTTKPRRKNRTLNREEKEYLGQMLEKIEDEELQERLKAFGEAFISDQNN